MHCTLIHLKKYPEDYTLSSLVRQAFCPEKHKMIAQKRSLFRVRRNVQEKQAKMKKTLAFA